MKDKLKGYLSKYDKVYFLLKKIFFPVYRYYVKYRFYQSTNRKRKLIQKKGFELLEKIHVYLNKEEIGFFIDFGTLLGIVREKGFIKHDLDIDIGVIKKDDKTINKVKSLLINGGFVLKFEYIYEDKIVEQSFLYKGIKFDICYYEENKKISKCYLFYRDSEEEANYPDNSLSVVQMTYDKIRGIEKCIVGIHEFNIPMDAEKILQQKYGPDWRIPNSKWIYWKSPSATKCKGFGIQEIYS